MLNWAASIASVKNSLTAINSIQNSKLSLYLIPPFSSALTPSAVLPPGLVTSPLSTDGCLILAIIPSVTNSFRAFKIKIKLPRYLKNLCNIIV